MWFIFVHGEPVLWSESKTSRLLHSCCKYPVIGLVFQGCGRQHEPAFLFRCTLKTMSKRPRPVCIAPLASTSHKPAVFSAVRRVSPVAYVCCIYLASKSKVSKAPLPDEVVTSYSISSWTSKDRCRDSLWHILLALLNLGVNLPRISSRFRCGHVQEPCTSIRYLWNPQ